MSLSDEYRQLATLIDALESQGIAVREAAPVSGNGRDGTTSDRFTVQLEVALPEPFSLERLVVDETPTVDTETVGGDDDRETDVDTDDADTGAGGTADQSPTVDSDAGTKDASGETDATTDETNTTTDETDTTTDETDAAAASSDESVSDEAPIEDDDIVSCTHPDCNRTFETERGMKIHRTKAHPLSELVDPDARGAIHHDPEALAEVYEKYETFAEMTEALDVDVGAQAVRKQMIRHGIHEPEGQNSGDGASTVGPSGSESADTSPTPDASTTADATGSISDGGVRPSGDATNGMADRGEGAEGSGQSDRTPNGVEPTDASRNGTSDEGNDVDSATDDAAPATGDADSATDDADSTAADSTDDSDTAPADIGDAETWEESERVADRLPELDLPGSLSTEELLSAVETANTLYDVQRELDLDTETTRDVLSEYDLLELVSGRAASVRDREQMKSEIHERLRRAAT
jgi:hypothetical protein